MSATTAPTICFIVMTSALRRWAGCFGARVYYHWQHAPSVAAATTSHEVLVNTPALPAPYHHGDLRRALLNSATAILTETGRWDFSLREVARRAGVTHGS